MSGLGSSSSGLVSRRRFQRSHETGEVVDIFEIIVARIGQAVRFGNFCWIIIRDGGRHRWVAGSGHFGLLQRVRDSHFIQVGISREGEETGMLVFPAETSDAVAALGLGNRHSYCLATDLSARCTALFPA